MTSPRLNMHINNLVPSLYDITNFHFNLSSFLTRSNHSLVDMILQNTLLCLAFILEPFHPIWIRICRHFERVDIERWRELFDWVYGTCIPSISTEHVEVLWAGLGYVRKGILVGWVILGVGISLVLIWSWLLSRWNAKSVLPRILFENDNVLDNPLPNFILGSSPRVEGSRSTSTSTASNSKRGFTSTPSSRTQTTTSTAPTTHENGAKGQERRDPYADRQPPHLILLQYIYPNSSHWPPYYLQAFRKAQESIEKMKEGTATSHIDAPVSGNTRRSKTDWTGKIVLDSRVLEKDLFEGRIGYRDGVKDMVSCL